MSGLFVNYRREDAAPYAGRLYDHLRKAFPEKEVFMDIDSIDLGEDFTEAIDRTLAESKVVLAVIGPDWGSVKDATGGRRLDNPDDLVVRELSSALDRKVRVIPVLVGGASMPSADSLPVSLRPLLNRNAIELSDTRFVADTERLCTSIARVLGKDQAGPLRAEIQATHVVDAMTTFKTLVWTLYAMSFVTVGFQFARIQESSEIIGSVVVTAILLAFFAWYNVKLLNGRNWARMFYLALTFVAVPCVLIDLDKQSWVEIAFNFVSLVLTLWVLKMMFTDPVRQVFLRDLGQRAARS